MPVSFLDVAHLIIGKIGSLQPKSILDIGCGYGTYGHLIRAHVDKYPWQIRLDAVEGFPQYLDRVGNRVYDNVCRVAWNTDTFNYIKNHRPKYDLILLIDVIEHFEKEEGFKVLEQCKSISKNVLVSTPTDPAEQGAEYGNELEVHKSRWTHEDFHRFGWNPILVHSHAVIGLI